MDVNALTTLKKWTWTCQIYFRTSSPAETGWKFPEHLLTSSFCAMEEGGLSLTDSELGFTASGAFFKMILLNALCVCPLSWQQVFVCMSNSTTYTRPDTTYLSLALYTGLVFASLSLSLSFFLLSSHTYASQTGLITAIMYHVKKNNWRKESDAAW